MYFLCTNFMLYLTMRISIEVCKTSGVMLILPSVVICLCFNAQRLFGDDIRPLGMLQKVNFWKSEMLVSSAILTFGPKIGQIGPTHENLKTQLRADVLKPSISIISSPNGTNILPPEAPPSRVQMGCTSNSLRDADWNDTFWSSSEHKGFWASERNFPKMSTLVRCILVVVPGTRDVSFR